jgi:hypothetical protein
MNHQLVEPPEPFEMPPLLFTMIMKASVIPRRISRERIRLTGARAVVVIGDTSFCEAIEQGNEQNALIKTVLVQDKQCKRDFRREGTPMMRTLSKVVTKTTAKQ